MKINKLGHCCMLIEENGLRILTDPGNYTTAQNDVKNIDIVLITHEHADHLHMESLKIVLENNPKAQTICNGSVGKILQAEKISYHEVGDGQIESVRDVKFSGHGTEHAEIYEDYKRVENTSYFIGQRLFYPGDAFYVPKQRVEILALPVSGPWMSIREAIKYALELKPKKCFPVHDGMLKITGGAHWVPQAILPPKRIEFEPLKLKKEYQC